MSETESENSKKRSQRRTGGSRRPADSPQRSKTRGKKSAAAAKKVAVAPPDEAKLNAPDRPTLVMLGVVCVSTLVFWAAGRSACNYHVPGESLTPRKVQLKDRARTPKHVGYAFAHALSAGDFATAKKLAADSAQPIVKKEQAGCGACVERKKTSDALRSVATLVRANSIDALVEVRTWGAPGGETRRLLGVERIEREWRVTRELPSLEHATLKEPPPRNTTPLGIRRLEPAPAANPAPSPSPAAAASPAPSPSPAAPASPAPSPSPAAASPAPSPSPAPAASPAPSPSPAPTN